MKHFKRIFLLPILTMGIGVSACGANTYMVTWKNYDDVILETDHGVKSGETPHYDGKDPTRRDESGYTYTWTGWTPEIQPVTGDITYIATYKETKVHKVSFYKIDKIPYISDVKVKDGEKVAKPDDPLRYCYDFVEWCVDEELTTAYDFSSPVSGNLELFAKWKLAGEFKDLANYTFTVSDDDHEITVTGYKDTSVTELTIPDCVDKIGYDALKGCSSLKTLVIPETVSEIAGAAFKSCTALESITIPFVGGSLSATHDSFASIFDTEHYGHEGEYLPETLTTVVVTRPCTTIPGYAFSDCKLLTSITLPDTLTTIGSNAFKGCKGLTSMNIPESVTSIGFSAFYECTNLMHISLPDSLVILDNNVFAYCEKLHYNFSCNANYLGNTDNPYVVLAKLEDKSFYSYTIDNKTKVIGYSSFYGAQSLKSIEIPNSVKSIGDSAFAYCSKLTSITIPDTVTAIGSAAFMRCDSLASITLPGSITAIEENLFLDCGALQTINYEGTKAQWNALEKGRNWHFEVPATEVVCSDGSVSLS